MSDPSSWPVPTTVIYPAYCYKNFSVPPFTIGCTTQLILSLLALFNVPPLTYLLYQTLKRNGRKKPLKPIALLAMLLS